MHVSYDDLSSSKSRFLLAFRIGNLDGIESQLDRRSLKGTLAENLLMDPPMAASLAASEDARARWGIPGKEGSGDDGSSFSGCDTNFKLLLSRLCFFRIGNLGVISRCADDACSSKEAKLRA